MSSGCEWHIAWAMMMQLQAAAAVGRTHGMLACDMQAWQQLQLDSEYNVVDGWRDVDIAWPQLQLDSEHNVEEEFREVDVTMELVRVATSGLAVIGHSIRIAEILREQLLPVIATFSSLQTSRHAEVDEVRAVLALMRVDALLNAQEEAPRLPLLAVKLLRDLQRLAQDVVVLACSSFIDQNLLQSKGIPAALLHRLEQAFFPTPLGVDRFSRLGNSKYHIWTPDIKWGDRKHRRRGRCTKISQTMEAEPLHIYPLENTTTPEDISLKLQQLEAVLQKHRVYSESLMDDIKKTVFSESLMSF